MIKNVFLLVAVLIVVLPNIFVFSQIIVPIRWSRDTNCSLSENATRDYYDIRGYIWSFLEDTETDFRKISIEEKRQGCQIAKQHLSELVAQGKKDWANCLTDSFDYFGGFVNDTLQNFLDFFCEESNKNMVEGYFTEEAKQCRVDIRKPLFDNCLMSLLAKKHEKISYDLDFNTFLIPGKKDNLCRELLDIAPCTADILKTHCPNLDDYQELSQKLFAQTIRPCDEYVTYTRAAGIIGWIFFIISVIICLVLRFCPVRQWYADFRHRATSKSLIC